MDNAQVLERFSRLEAAITQAAQACRSDPQTSSVLDAAVSELEQRAQTIRAELERALDEQAEDPAVLFECADLLKTAGDRAAALCDQHDASTRMHDVVDEVQNEIAHFRRQLHAGGGQRRESRPLHRPAPR